jgi:2-polyprenyl-3-methyl-5-hydroxy-6-metoxy-1,4-benzoquinol methylase
MNAEKQPVAHNVDHEIAKFEAVASRWWDLEGEFKPLHRINPLRLAILRSVLAACLAKRYSMSAAAAASLPRAWRVKAQR